MRGSRYLVSKRDIRIGKKHARGPCYDKRVISAKLTKHNQVKHPQCSEDNLKGLKDKHNRLVERCKTQWRSYSCVEREK